MKKVDWRAVRSAVLAYASSGAIGAAIGAYYGLRNGLHKAHTTPGASPLPDMLFGAGFGCLVGLVFWRLRWMRKRDGPYYFLSWGLSFGTAVAVVLLPTILRTREWLSFIVVLVAGIVAGCGFGALVFLAMRAQEGDNKKV